MTFTLERLQALDESVAFTETAQLEKLNEVDLSNLPTDFVQKWKAFLQARADFNEMKQKYFRNNHD